MNLSSTMQAAIEYARQNDNKIVRIPGGFWARPEWAGPHEQSFGTTTIQALVDRGIVTYTRWQQRRNGSSEFPVEVTLKEATGGAWKVIFLDIDGVMNNLESLRFPRTKVECSTQSYSAAHPACVEALNFITRVTDARLVISSTWRGIGLKVLFEVFHAWGVKGVIVGRTPDGSRKSGSVWAAPERGDEIKQWLDTYPGITSFVILDDGDDMGELIPNLVQTDYEIGLTMDDAKRAIALLNQQSEAAA